MSFSSHTFTYKIPEHTKQEIQTIFSSIAAPVGHFQAKSTEIAISRNC